MLLGGIYMLNDYEISNLSNNHSNKLISILKLMAASFVVLCTFILLPSWIEDFKEARTDDSLKVRVIANSNTIKDQQMKMDVVDTLSPLFVRKEMSNEKWKDEATSILSTKYGQESINVKLENHLTPPKWSEGAFYPQGYYNTLVVTIGDGRGDNFWCSLFSDVCKGPNQEEEESDDEKEEVTFIIWEWMKQIFS